MEHRNTQTIARQTNFDATLNYDHDGELTNERLDALLAANAETAREKSCFVRNRKKRKPS
jgi:hypothetical protein